MKSPAAITSIIVFIKRSSNVFSNECSGVENKSCFVLFGVEYQTQKSKGFRAQDGSVVGAGSDVKGQYAGCTASGQSLTKRHGKPFSLGTAVHMLPLPCLPGEGKTLGLGSNCGALMIQMRERIPLRYSLSWIRPIAKTFLPASLREAPQ